jgi:hypothetical protein
MVFPFLWVPTGGLEYDPTDAGNSLVLGRWQFTAANPEQRLREAGLIFQKR